MKKIFILTGEPSGDKLASKVIKEFKKDNSNIEYLSVGGENLQALGIKSIKNARTGKKYDYLHYRRYRYSDHHFLHCILYS